MKCCCAVWSPFDFQRTLIILLILYFWTVLRVKNNVAEQNVFSINLRFRISITSGSRGGPRGPGARPPPWPPDLEAPVYNLRAKQWILEPLFYIFLKKFFSLASLSMNLILFSHSSSLTLLIISMFHILVHILLHYMDSTHNLSCL